jgi:hypothetical protein
MSNAHWSCYAVSCVAHKHDKLQWAVGRSTSSTPSSHAVYFAAVCRAIGASHIVVYYTEGDDAPLSDDELRGQSVSQTAVDAFLFGVSPVAAATRRCALDVANQYTYVMTLGTHQHLMAGRAMLNSLLASDTIRLAPGALLHDPALAGLSPRHVIH